MDGVSLARAARDALPPFAEHVRRVLAAREPARRESTASLSAAAVLLALFEGAGGEPRLWLIRRPDGLRTHAGQVALPGGRRDPADADLVATALREADEEIALPTAAVEILGVEDELVTVTRFHVTPVVGWITRPFDPRPNPVEVSRVFSAPLAAFRERGVARVLPFESWRRIVRSYPVEGETVWGATAAILGAFALRVGA